MNKLVALSKRIKPLAMRSAGMKEHPYLYRDAPAVAESNPPPQHPVNDPEANTYREDICKHDPYDSSKEKGCYDQPE